MPQDLDKQNSPQFFLETQGPSFGFQKTYPTTGPVADVTNYGAIGDGITNNAAAFTRAMTSGANVVYVPQGLYLTNSNIFIPNGVNFVQGPGTVKLNAADPSGLFWADNHPGPLTIRDLTLDTVDTTSQIISFFDTCTNMFVDHCNFLHSSHLGINFDNGVDSVVNNCRFQNLGYGAIFMSAFSRVALTNNNILANRTNTASAIQASVGKGLVVSGNRINGSVGFSIFVFDGTEFIISNNTILNGGLEGVRVDSFAATTESWEVIGNVIDNPDNASTDFGIGVGSNTASTLRKGLISNNFVRRAGKVGILASSDSNVSSATNGIVIKGNMVVNPNTLNDAGSTYAIGVTTNGGSLKNTVVSENNIQVDNGFIAIGVRELAPADWSRFYNNIVLGASGAAVQTAGANSTSGNNISGALG